MKALLICPGERFAVARLAESRPLAVAPMYGKTFIEYWLEHLFSQGVREAILAVSDRPDQVRAVVGDGARWGLQIEVVSETRELSIEEARRKYCAPDNPASASPELVILAEHLPGNPLLRPFDSYENWFTAIREWRPRVFSPDRIGREIRPGIWVGLRSRIALTAQLRAPCWIGENVLVGADAVVGPDAVLEDNVVIEDGARVENSLVGPQTFVGTLTLVSNSIASGSTLINWKTGSQLDVPDPFLLGPLEEPRDRLPAPSWLGRIAALLVMLLTSPFAFFVALKSKLRDEPALRLRWAVRPRATVRVRQKETFSYYELRGAAGWLRRWPQLWSVVHGDFTWIGNRPLTRSEASLLATDFQRLWLTTPVGLISLADAEYCREGVTAETCAHASYYAVRATPRLQWSIFARALIRAASSKILWQDRHKDVPVSYRILKPQG
jgi:hypothetical protein